MTDTPRPHHEDPQSPAPAESDEAVVEDNVDEALIESFPASDPPAQPAKVGR